MKDGQILRYTVLKNTVLSCVLVFIVWLLRAFNTCQAMLDIATHSYCVNMP